MSINENVNQPVSDLSGTPSTKVSQSIPKGSRVDYSLYTMRDRNDDVVVVIMETKMEACSKNVKAQVRPHDIYFFCIYWASVLVR